MLRATCGLPSLAVYRTAFDAVGWSRIRELRYAPREVFPFLAELLRGNLH